MATPERDNILDFIRAADRGVIRGLRHHNGRHAYGGGIE